MTPETRLIHAVIQQAVLDLFAISPAGASERGVAERREALAFLTASQGAWARQRDEFCTIIDLDPDLVRAEIVAILEGAEPRIKIGRGLDRARALWAEQNTRPSRLPRPPKPAPLPTRSTLTADDVAAFVRLRGEVTIAEVMRHFEVSDVVAIGRLRTLKNRGDVISPKPGTYCFVRKRWHTPPPDPNTSWLYDGIELPPDSYPAPPRSAFGAPGKAA